jgi:hypothetical protein
MATKIKLKQLEDSTSGYMIKVNVSGEAAYVNPNTIALSSFNNDLGGSGLTVGTTTITSGTNTRVLYNNNGVVGEYAVTGTGTTAVLSTDPTFTSNSGTIKLGNITASFPAMWFQNAAPSSTNYTLACDDYDNQLNSLGSTQVRFSNVSAVNITNQSLALYSASTDFFLLTKPSYTVPSITEHRSIRNIAGTRTWANSGGAQTLSTQREVLFSAPTYATSGGGSLTITNSYNAWFDKATASGITITNNYAAGFGGDIFVNGNTATTTINKVTVTAPATGSTLTIANNKTFTVNNSISLTGTDSTTMTMPSITSTLAGLQDVYFPITNSCGLTTFTASATSYIGGLLHTAAPRGTNAAVATGIPYNCTLVGATIITWQNGAGASQTNSTVYFRLNDTTDVTLSSAVLWNNSSQVTNNINVTGLSTSINAGDTYSIKIVMGALATAPSTATIQVILYFARR